MGQTPSTPPPPDLLAELVEQLKRLPGIGEKGALRLALFLIRSPAELSESLARAIAGARRHTTLCPLCFNLSPNGRSSDGLALMVMMTQISPNFSGSKRAV